MIDLSLLSFVIFVILLASLIYYKRRKLLISGILIMYKTERGKKNIDSLAKRWPRFWHHFGTVGVIVAIFARET